MEHKIGEWLDLWNPDWRDLFEASHDFCSDDLEFERTRGLAMTATTVRVVHTPTGCVGYSADPVSGHWNRRKALLMLAQKLAEHEASPKPA